MGSPRKTFAITAMGSCLLAVAALGSASPGEKAPTTKQAPSCCHRDGAIRSGVSVPSAIGTILLVPAQPAAPQKKAEQAAKASPASVAKGVATRKALLDQVSSLMEDGVADCCTGPGCALCVIAADSCGCAASLAQGGPVCPECWGGWQAGQGMLPDVTPEKVKILPKEQLKKVYDLKAKKLEEAGG